MNNIERHVAEIKRVKEEIKKANPNGIHVKDLKRYLKRLQNELKEYEYWMKKAR